VVFAVVLVVAVVDDDAFHYRYDDAFHFRYDDVYD
jgi:hypothetical protein